MKLPKEVPYGSNRSLAEDYLRVIAYFKVTFDEHRRYDSQAKRIALSPVNITSFYKKNGGLEKLSEPVMVEDTKQILELIIHQGAEKADEVMELARDRRIEMRNEGIRSSWNSRNPKLSRYNSF